MKEFQSRKIPSFQSSVHAKIFMKCGLHLLRKLMLNYMDAMEILSVVTLMKVFKSLLVSNQRKCLSEMRKLDASQIR
jgi:hypothetical protein